MFSATTCNATNASPTIRATTNGLGHGLQVDLTNVATTGKGLIVNQGGSGGGIEVSLTRPANGSTAVMGTTQGAGTGVQAVSALGVGVVAIGGSAPLYLGPRAAVGAPTTGNHFRGEVSVDDEAGLFMCKVGNGTNLGTWLRVGYNPIDPIRILDTREEDAPMTEGEELLVAVIDGVAPIPKGATVVTLNVTAVGPTGFGGFLSLYPATLTFTSGSPPTFSNVNFTNGDSPTANQATIKIAPPDATNAGKIKVFNAFGDTHVILDIAGFYS